MSPTMTWQWLCCCTALGVVDQVAIASCSGAKMSVTWDARSPHRRAVGDSGSSRLSSSFEQAVQGLRPIALRITRMWTLP